MPETNEPPADYLDTDAIQNLDTARMALRWALERIQKLDREKSELADRLALEERAKKKALEEYASLQKTLSLRAGESDQRELYYAKLEEFLSLKLEGRLDLAALAKRELELEQLRQLLDHKQGALEKEYELKRANLESDYRRLKEEAESRLRDEHRRLEAAGEARRGSLEQEHLSRMADVHQREARVKQEEKALADRQAHFEDYYNGQRARLQAELKALRGEIEDQVRFRVEASERLIEERKAALEAAWGQERTLLSRELESWKRRGQELGPRVVELETAVALAEEAALRGQASADANAALLRERQGAWEAEKERLSALLAEARQAQSKAGEEIAKLSALLARAEEDARQSQAAADALSGAVEAEKKVWAQERRALETERDGWRQKAEDLLARSFDLGQRLAVADDSLEQTKAAAERQIALIEGRLKGARAESERLAAERQSEAQWAAKESQRANELETRIQTLEEQLARAKAEAAGEAQRWSERARFLETERQVLSEGLSAAREGERQARQALLDTERKIAAAEEAQAEAQRRCVRQETALQAAASERAALEAETAACRQSLSQAVARNLELERAMAIADETIRRLQAADDRHAARFDEQRQSWERERAELDAELSELKRRAVQKAELLVELEKKLASELAAERRGQEPEPPKP